MTNVKASSFPDIVYTKLLPVETHPVFNYNGFQPGKTTVLKKGHVKEVGFREFTGDVIYERDVEIVVRDGVRLFADVFRPAGGEGGDEKEKKEERVPVIIPWSPYGKTGTGPQNYDFMAPFRAGIPKNRTSGYEKFEAPDPAEWCGERGYAILNIDARGAGKSEGDIAFWGQQEAEDIYDVITWLTKQPWCSGSVAMAGNSWLAIAQLNFASRFSHPALKALAPWEAMVDPYRELIARGGRPHIPSFHDLIGGGFAGPGHREDITAMFKKRPLYDDYWESKRIAVENIDNIPLYLLASYSSMLHTHGSFNTFQLAKTKQKWLRVHPYQEWHDLYRPEINDELQRYFDRYCKNIQNGWEESTPPVRLTLLGFEGSPAKTVIERPENEYPLARQETRKYFLDVSNKTLNSSPVVTEAQDSYEAHSLDESLDFTLTFPTPTELAGYPLLKIHVSNPTHAEIDLCVQIRKISQTGLPLKHLNYPCPVPIDQVPNTNVAKTLGPQGFLRASHACSLVKGGREGLDVNDLFYTHRERRVVEKGEVVCLEVPIWPIGMVFVEGEGIMLRISGHNMSHPETEICRLTEPEDENVGRHVIHTGGKYESVLSLPVIPAKTK